MGWAKAAVTLALVALVAAVGPTVTAANEPPLADAGLDQSTDVNRTVYLDANGSRDPDGSIARAAWTIERPDGTTTTPDCETCRQTTFRPQQDGRYIVTLALTDDDGATREDTLYVAASAAGGPTVSLDGPPVAPPENETTVTATVDAGDSQLETIAWTVDGDVAARETLSGETATVTHTESFAEEKTVPVEAVVYDHAGRRGTATHTIEVGTPAASATGTGSPGTGGASGGGYGCPEGVSTYFHTGTFVGCADGADMVISQNGEQKLLDVNGEDGIQVHHDGELVTVSDVVDQPVSEFETKNGYDFNGISDALDEATEDVNERDTNETFGDSGGTSTETSNDGTTNSGDFGFTNDGGDGDGTAGVVTGSASGVNAGAPSINDKNSGQTSSDGTNNSGNQGFTNNNDKKGTSGVVTGGSGGVNAGTPSL